MSKYGFSLKGIINLLAPQANRRAGGPATTEKEPRRARQVKKYKKPHTGEVIETKGGNHRGLKEWKAEFGFDEVESWVAR
nr:histone-like nucleoid-structuring protein, MvaT/MvaU family [Pseudomonas alloputida]